MSEETQSSGPDWVARWQALGAAQATYLWALVVACIFYAAVDPAPPASSGALVKAPILDLELNTSVVALSGPAVLSFLVLIFMGALRATSVAVREAGVADFKGEGFDVHPNPLDLAFYTTKDAPRILVVLTYFKYPAFLTWVLAEALYLWRLNPAPKWHPALAVAAVLWIPGVWQVGAMWFGRVRKVPALLSR